MIRDTDTHKRPGERTYGNAVDSDLASLRKGREFAVERQKLGEDVSALLAYYDERIARLLHVR